MTELGYLAAPKQDGHIYGTLEYDAKANTYNIKAEPCVFELAKRVFPGCGGKHAKTIRFSASTRILGELNWLMLRYPLKIENPEQFEAHRQKAISYAQNRERNRDLTPTTPPPAFTGTLMPFQSEGVTYMISNEKTILSDEMGVGKTVQAIGAMATVNKWPVLVVCPCNVQRQWASMVASFLAMPKPGSLFTEPTSDGLAHICKGRTPYELPPAKIYIIHYGLLDAWKNVFQEMSPNVVVFDEVQELRRTGSYKYTSACLLSKDASYVWGLSGTPIYNYGEEIWSVLNAIEYHCLGDFDSFSMEWCTGYGTRMVEKPDVLGDYLRREGLMLRRRKADVLSQLPPKRRIVVPIDKDDSTYRKMIADAVSLARGYDAIKEWHDRGKAAMEMEQISRKAAGVSKAPYVADFVASLMEAGERVLLYSWHHDVHDILGEKLKSYKPVRITGKESQNQKEQAIKSFASGETNLVQLSLRATAGLDGLQERGTCVVFAELDWSPAIHTQAEDRLHRIGVQAESLLCYYMVCDSGSDDTMQEALGLKIGQFVGIMGDATESDEDRALSARMIERHLDSVIERLKKGG